MILINFEIWKMHAQFSIVPRSPCAIILINPKGTCLYLLMGFNVYLGPLVQVDGATSISTVSLVDVEVGSFSPYIFVPTPWAKHTKTTVRIAPSLGNSSCNKLDFSPPSQCRRQPTLTTSPVKTIATR